MVENELEDSHENLLEDLSERKKKKLGHVASREILWKTDGPKKDRGCSFYHSLESSGTPVF